jgi:hypothetical protein
VIPRRFDIDLANARTIGQLLDDSDLLLHKV